METRTLSEILDLLDQPGRFLCAELGDERTFYALRFYDERGGGGELDQFYLDKSAEAAIAQCGRCADFSDGTEHGLAYGPDCSCVSLAVHIKENRRRAGYDDTKPPGIPAPTPAPKSAGRQRFHIEAEADGGSLFENPVRGTIRKGNRVLTFNTEAQAQAAADSLAAERRSWTFKVVSV